MRGSVTIPDTEGKQRDVRETLEYVRIQTKKVLVVADYVDISIHCAKYLREYCNIYNIYFDNAFGDQH